jgi:hypothetical protein
VLRAFALCPPTRMDLEAQTAQHRRRRRLFILIAMIICHVAYYYHILFLLQTHINFPRFLPIFPDFLERLSHLAPIY